MLYALLKSLHIFGVIMLLGNAIVTMIWKMAADRTEDPQLIAFGQRLVTLTDWWFTVSGAAFLFHRHCQVLQRADGYGYSFNPTPREDARVVA